MPNLVHSVVSQLQHERDRLEKELQRITSALAAFGKAYRRAGTTARKHRISAEGRKRIAAAQRARWAKARAAAR